jgi:pyruvate/2-oxoacid:ferredoxin oxidoreductase alpha subunit
LAGDTGQRRRGTKVKDEDKKLAAAHERIERLERELHEYIRAEEVLIAAGVVTKAKVEQAHDIVRELR